MDKSSTYNAWKWVSLSPLPHWAIVVLVLALAVGVTLAAVGLRRESIVWRRVLLVSLRVGAGLAAFFFLLEPGIRQLQVARVKSRLAVLVDRSASMEFPAQVGGASRSASVGAYLQRISPALAGLSERYTLEYHGFDPELSPLDVSALMKEPARGGRSDLLGALKALGSGAGPNASASKRLAGVLLFSDGSDNVDLAGGLAGRPASSLEALKVPVSTFVVGEAGLKDLAIERVKVDDFAFVRNSLTVEAEVRARGFSGQTVQVVLRQEGQVVGTQAVSFSSDDALETVTFTFTPQETGRFVFTLAAPVFPEEAVKENNERSFVLKVIRDRVRVLFVVGRPSWDERFLRGLLRQDPNVDLVSFFILRSTTDDPMVRSPERELSLIPFPMREIFDEKLSTFDLVVFQNFGYTDSALSISLYERNLEQYVHNGGAFLIIGGDHSFGLGRARFPVLGEALPVDSNGDGVDEASFQPKLTPEGMRHPVTAIGSGRLPLEGAWASLPAIPGANLTRAKNGATVLLEHPQRTVDGKPAPILALWDYGRGRSMALTTDGSWYWSFPAHRDGSPERLYDRLFNNAIRWLVRDPALTTLQVVADPATVEPGKPLGVIVTARSSDYQASPDAEIVVELVATDGRGTLGTRTGVAGADGTLRLEFPPQPAGAYRFKATAKKGEQVLGEGEDVVAVRAVGSELSDARARPDLLSDIAKVTGGKAFRLAGLDELPDLPLLEPPVVEVGRSKDAPLWDRWYFLAAVVVLLGSEWFLRRRFGHI